jgi:hypothetical protein
MSSSSCLLVLLLLVFMDSGMTEGSDSVDGESIPEEYSFLLPDGSMDRMNGENSDQSPPAGMRRLLRDSSNCHSLPSEIHVTKEETDESGNVVRVCEGTIRVAKCEGVCLSELRPSVHSTTGFAKVSSFFAD